MRTSWSRRTGSVLACSAYGLDSGREIDWRQEAECGSGWWDPDWWSSTSGLRQAQARWICQHLCPVLAECLPWAQEDPLRVGGTVAGGVLWTLRNGRSRLAMTQPRSVRPDGVDARVAARSAR